MDDQGGVDGFPDSRLAPRPAVARGSRRRAPATPADSSSSLAAGQLGACWCCVKRKELTKKYHGVFLCQECWNGIRAKHRSIKKSNSKEEAQAQMERDTRLMESDPPLWRQLTLPFCEIATRKEASESFTRELSEHLRVEADLFMQDKIGLTKKRFKSFHKFWDQAESDDCSDQFEDMLVEQRNIALVPKINNKGEDIAWVDDNMRFSKVAGTEERNGRTKITPLPCESRSSWESAG